MQFSGEQRAAIEARNRELLVSAAAGSGKTAVLIEKIFTLIKDEGIGVDRMLVVTFTRAAAAEMRDRLKQRLAGESEPRLRRERDKLELAHISTLHSFCHQLTQEFFQAADVDPLSAVADQTVSRNLFSEALDSAMDALYARAAEGSAPEMALTAKFEDKQIAAMAETLYPFLMTLADPLGFLRGCAETAYTLADLETGPMAETLLADCRVLLSGADDLADDLLALSRHPDCPAQYLPALQSDRDAVSSLRQTAAHGLPALVRAAQAFELVRMPSLRGLDDAQKDLNQQYKDLREALKKRVGSIGGLFRLPPDTLIARLNAMQPALMGLSRLCETLHSGFLERKKSRALLDPNDLEHMALAVLADPEIRQAVAARFDAVFVDEYQDISGVQEAVLNAVKRPAGADVSRETSGTDGQPAAQAANGAERAADGNALPQITQRFFYVGDVKQSIYRFRQADPTLFMEKERTFADAKDASQRRIDLNRNYRSRGAVLNAVNRVFAHVMRPDVTEIAYDSRARLYPGQETQNDPPVTLHLFTQPLKSAERVRVQAAAIAREIEARVGQPFLDRKENRMRTLRYRDIAVLAPRMKGVDEVLTRVLSSRRIPAYAEGGGAGLQSDEIAQVLCHLRLMDNIRDDLSLLACLRSPAMGLSDEELAQVRIRTPRGSYLDALRAAAEGADALSKRAADALQTLEHERFLMRSMPLPDYLWQWLSRSGLYAYYGCQPYGRLRQANLQLLCEKAAQFQARGGGDLKAFLASVVAGSAVRESVSPTVLGPREDVVRVMSVHKSKGLEFPVVFLMGLDAPFEGAGNGEFKLHARLGAALPYVDEVLRVKGDTLLSAAIGLRQKSENLAERARVLYVGMTRARDELVLMGCADSPRFSASQPSAYAVGSAKHMLDWLLQSVRPNEDELIACEPPFSSQSTSFPHKTGGFRLVSHNTAEETAALLAFAQAQADQDSLQKQRSRLEILTSEVRGLVRQLPTSADPWASPIAPPFPRDRRPFKVGVTALVRARGVRGAEVPELSDPEQDDAADRETVRIKRLPLPLTRPRQIADLPRLPAFLREGGESPRGVQRGIAAHKALSLLSYEPLRPLQSAQALRDAIEEQLRSFAQRRLLTDEELRLTDPAALADFFASEWGRAALAAQTVHREWGFVLQLPEEQGMLVQGVIDLCFLQDGKWALLDYKTDAVTDVEALWPLYEAQTALYRRALVEVTGIPVQSVTLYSLSLGRGTTRSADNTPPGQ